MFARPGNRDESNNFELKRDEYNLNRKRSDIFRAGRCSLIIEIKLRTQGNPPERCRNRGIVKRNFPPSRVHKRQGTRYIQVASKLLFVPFSRSLGSGRQVEGENVIFLSPERPALFENHPPILLLLRHLCMYLLDVFQVLRISRSAQSPATLRSRWPSPVSLHFFGAGSTVLHVRSSSSTCALSILHNLPEHCSFPRLPSTT